MVVAAIGAFAVWPRGATPVTEQQALDTYRSRVDDTSAPGTNPSASATRPEAGVYTFAASGQEVVKLGVLPAETRPYPATITAIVVHDEASCFTLTLNLVDQHTEDTTYCVDGPDTLRIDAHHKHQQIGAISPSATMTCDPSALVAPGTDHRSLACTMSLSGGPAQLTASLAGTVQVNRTASVTVGGEDVAAIAVDVVYQIGGDLTGTWHEQLWFTRDDWLPLRIERHLDLRGLASFTEDSTLELTDTSPRS